MATKKSSKAKQGEGFHHFVAAGGNPKDYKASRGVNSSTVNNIKNK